MPPSIMFRRSPGAKPRRAASSGGTKWCWTSMIIASFRADHHIHDGRPLLLFHDPDRAPEGGGDLRGILDRAVAVRPEGAGHRRKVHRRGPGPGADPAGLDPAPPGPGPPPPGGRL